MALVKPLHPPLFTLSNFTSKGVVYAPAERADTLPSPHISPLPLYSICTLGSSVTSSRLIAFLYQAFVLYLPSLPSVLVLGYMYFCTDHLFFKSYPILGLRSSIPSAARFLVKKSKGDISRGRFR